MYGRIAILWLFRRTVKLNQAQRYEYLVELTDGKKLDSDYRAAFYILSSVPELFEAAKKCVDPYGISFDKKGPVKEIWRNTRVIFCLWHIIFSHGTAGRPPRPMNCPVLPIRGWDCLQRYLHIQWRGFCADTGE